MVIKRDLSKLGILYLVVTAVVFGVFIGLFTNYLPHIQVMTLVILAACLIIAHFLMSKRISQQKHKPIEILIILFADIVFGLFLGATEGIDHPEIKLITALLLAICGFVGLWLLVLKDRGIIKVKPL